MHIDVQVSGLPLFVAGNATITGDVTIGKQVGIWFGAVIRADRDRIVIGDRSNIQDNCVVHTSKGFPVTIGNDVSVGHGAILHGCTIGNQVLIGMGAIILNGAKIGDGSIIGAGAVITEGKRYTAELCGYRCTGKSRQTGRSATSSITFSIMPLPTWNSPGSMPPWVM